MLEAVFGMFFAGPQRSRPAYGGLGIGLTLVRSLVELHGGTVTAHSDGAARGSRFGSACRASSARQKQCKTDPARRHRRTRCANESS